MGENLSKSILLRALERTGAKLDWPCDVEILLIGAAAGLMAGWLRPSRTTGDCDIIQVLPAEAQQAVLQAANQAAGELDLPEGWLSDQAMRLNILPDGWRSRRQLIDKWGRLHVYILSRKDFLALKIYAGRSQDCEDVIRMKITPEETDFVRRYLRMLTVPSRQANLDQVQSAAKFLSRIERMGEHERD